LASRDSSGDSNPPRAWLAARWVTATFASFSGREIKGVVVFMRLLFDGHSRIA
jgi:hypothetical protein